LHTLRIGCLDPTKDMCSKTISSGAQYVTLKTYFSRPNLVIYFLATPPIKLKLGQQTGGGVLIANHLDQSLWWVNQKHWAVVRSYLLLFSGGAQVLRLPFSHFKLCNYTEPIPLAWAKPLYFDFPSSNCTVQVHILSTNGDALIAKFSKKHFLYWENVLKHAHRELGEIFQCTWRAKVPYPVFATTEEAPSTDSAFLQKFNQSHQIYARFRIRHLG